METPDAADSTNSHNSPNSVSPSLDTSANQVYHQIPQPESCPEFIEHNIDQVVNKAGVRQSSSELLSLGALSLIDKQQMNKNKREVKKTSNNRAKNNSEKSSDSSDNNSISYKQSEFLSPVSGEEPFIEINANIRALEMLESDDTSYAKAIRHNYHKHNANDISSCDDDDTDRCIDRSRGLLPSVCKACHKQASNGRLIDPIGAELTIANTRRRAQSLGGLQSNRMESVAFCSESSVAALDVTNAGSNYDNTHNIESTFIRLFPYLNRSEANHLRTGSSCPHVRCDIVEYL